MPKWTYQTFLSPRVLWSRFDNRVTDWLNKRGAAGWEVVELQLLVNKKSGAPTQWVGLFKRQVAEATR